MSVTTTRMPGWSATVVWASMILAVTLPRSYPGLPGSVPVVLEVAALAAAIPVLIRGGVRQWRMAGLFSLVPLVGIALATYRGEVGDCVPQVATALTLLVGARLDYRTGVTSAMNALVGLVAVSVAVGLRSESAVELTGRSYLGPLFHGGRLVGILQTPNVVGQLGAVLVAIALLIARGPGRVIYVGTGLLAILAASSQTALVSVLAAGVAYATVALIERGWGWAAAAGWAGAAALAGVITTYAVFVATPGTALGELPSTISLSNRTNIWTFLFSQQVPFTGLGQSQLSALISGTTIRGAAGVSTAHDAWLDAYFRDGVPGLTALAVVVATIGWLVIRRRAWAALIPLVVLLTEGITEVTPTHAPFYGLYFLAIAYGLGQRTRYAVPARHRAGAQRIHRVSAGYGRYYLDQRTVHAA